MFRILYTNRFKYNLIEIKDYISLDNPFYAVKVIFKIETTIKILKTFPFLWKEIDKNKRVLIDPKYRFKIVYEIRDNTIYIVSVFKYKNSWE